MKDLFQDYRFVLLDASCFVSLFSEELRQGLSKIPVYAAETFDAEVTQYLKILPEDKKTIFEENLAFLKSTMSSERMNVDGCENEVEGLCGDTWGVLNLLVRKGSSVVLLTADQLLIQRVILENLKVDIYALNTSLSWNEKVGSEGFIRSRDFPRYRPMLELVEDVPWPAGEQHDFLLKDNMTLYKKDGSQIALGKEIASGAEAHIFQVRGASGLVAKILKKEKLPPSKYVNIKAIQGANRMLNVPWALFPIDVLHYDPECRIPAGFTERKARTTGDLDEHPLYMGDLDIEDCYLATKVTETLKLCIQIVRQVKYMNVYGFLLSDFNAGNFATMEDCNDAMQMWDTDSFGHGTFFSGYYSGNRTSREYDISCKMGAIGFCSEQLYLLIFSLLSLGDYPINEWNGTFKYDDSEYYALFRKTFFPSNVWNLLQDVFRKTKLPSVDMLLHELHTALNDYSDDWTLNKSYAELLKPIFEAYDEQDEDDTDDTDGVSNGSSDGNSDGSDQDEWEVDSGKKLPDWLISALVAAAVTVAAFIIGKL